MNESYKYQEYIELLKANKNLILTGAPGTGKTFLAREIAKAMNAEYTLVQFHPSYDRLRLTRTGILGLKGRMGYLKSFVKKLLFTENNRIILTHLLLPNFPIIHLPIKYHQTQLKNPFNGL